MDMHKYVANHKSVSMAGYNICPIVIIEIPIPGDTLFILKQAQMSETGLTAYQLLLSGTKRTHCNLTINSPTM